MPSAKIPIDGLCHCLCPSFDARLLAESQKLRRSVNIVNNRCASSWISPVQRHAPSRQLALSAHARNQQQEHALGRDTDRSRQFFTQRSPVRETNHGLRPPNTSTAQLYEKLRSVSAKGNSNEVEQIVGVLLQEHDEAPNLRLYTALILSNTDPQNGSAAKAARLVQEMMDEGINADSGTYHALLKVGSASHRQQATCADKTLCQVLAIHPDYNLRSDILEELRQRWFALTNAGWHDVVAGLLKEKQLELALDKLEQMQRDGVQVKSWLHDMFTYTLCEVEEFEAATTLLKHRIAGGEMVISGNLWFFFLDSASRAFHACLPHRR